MNIPDSVIIVGLIIWAMVMVGMREYNRLDRLYRSDRKVSDLQAYRNQNTPVQTVYNEDMKVADLPVSAREVKRAS